jgi:hypothetical protein
MMAAFPPRNTFKIGNIWWRDVTNETCSTAIFTKEEAIAHSYGYYLDTSGLTRKKKKPSDERLK